MAAGIFGALGALGNLGNQMAEGQQMAHEEMIRRLAEQQERQTATLNQQRIRQQIAQTAQNMKLAKQPVPLGAPYVSNGKVLQRYQDPTTGAFSVSELPGGLPETPEQQELRGLMAFPGMTPEKANEIVEKQLLGKASYKREVQPDANSFTGYSAVFYDGQVEAYRVPTLAPRGLNPQETTRVTTDPYGLTSTSTTIRRPLTGSGVPLSGPAGRYGTPAPQNALGAVRSAVGLPVFPGAQAGAPGAQAGVNRQAAPPKQASAPTAQGGVPAGPYRGLDQNGQIPADRGINPLVRQFAQNIIDGGDVNKIPAKVRALAESVAQKYGWKGQGSLTPAQQMQIEQVDNALANISQPKYMKLFDSAATSLHMSMLPLDPSTQGDLAALRASGLRRTLTPDEATFIDTLTRLRGVITGIRSFTGANNSNATADRLLAELPNFSNVTNAADARYKIDLLRQELSIIKRLGYFLPADQAPTGRAQSAPGTANDNPMGLDLTPPGGGR